jgi:hypothetical protein
MSGAEFAYSASIICKLCAVRVTLRAEGDITYETAGAIDREAVRRAIAQGVCPVDLPHIQTRTDALRAESHLPPYKISIYTTRAWICGDCARCIMQAFTLDAGIVIEVAPELPPGPSWPYKFERFQQGDGFDDAASVAEYQRRGWFSTEQQITESGWSEINSIRSARLAQ